MATVASSPPKLSTPTSARTADTLVREIASGALDANTVTQREERVLLAWCRDSVEKRKRQIAAAHARGAFRQAREAGHKLRSSLAGRYLALWHSKPATFSDRATLPTEERDMRRTSRIAAIVTMLDFVGDLGMPASADVFAKRKRSAQGVLTQERRVLFSFPWLDRARQRLIAESIEPLADLHPRQFLLRADGGRGRSAVCEELRRELPKLPDTYVFMQLDVRRFFGSISPTWMERRLGLPAAIVRRHVHTGEMSLRMMMSVRAYLSGGEQEELVRQVLPEGSALASLVAEMAMADVLRGLADHLSGLLLIVYSDNLGIFVPREEAAAVEDLFRGAFARSDAGPFQLHPAVTTSIHHNFRFLGHWWQMRDGALQVYVPEEKAEARAAQITDGLLTASGTELAKMKGRVRAQANEWKLWAGVDEWEAEAMTLIRAQEAYLLDQFRQQVAA